MRRSCYRERCAGSRHEGVGVQPKAHASIALSESYRES